VRLEPTYGRAGSYFILKYGHPNFTCTLCERKCRTARLAAINHCALFCDRHNVAPLAHLCFSVSQSSFGISDLVCTWGWVEQALSEDRAIPVHYHVLYVCDWAAGICQRAASRLVRTLF
jgi:hypothetical protein